MVYHLVNAMLHQTLECLIFLRRLYNLLICEMLNEILVSVFLKKIIREIP